MTKRSQLIKI